MSAIRPSNFIVELSDKDFEGQNLKKYSNKLVLIKFYAPWCGYCVRSMPEYEELAKQYSLNKNIVIARLDCQKYNNFIDNEFNKFNHGPKIHGYPTILLYKNNMFRANFNSNRTLDAYKNFIISNA
jgi:thiol-disulfide isomerase/thioredoxin